MSKSATFIIIILLIIIAGLTWVLWVKPAEAPSVPVEATPTSTGTVITPAPTTTTTPAPLHTKIVVTYPKANASVPKNFTVTGQAPGNWFFEASAPVMVQDPEGNKLAQGIAQAQGDWMTTNLVAFTAVIKTNPAYSGPATLILLKDNPSGLPENEDSLEIPIVIQ